MKCYRVTLSLLYSFISYSVWLLLLKAKPVPSKKHQQGLNVTVLKRLQTVMPERYIRLAKLRHNLQQLCNLVKYKS